MRGAQTNERTHPSKFADVHSYTISRSPAIDRHGTLSLPSRKNCAREHARPASVVDAAAQPGRRRAWSSVLTNPVTRQARSFLSPSGTTGSASNSSSSAGPACICEGSRECAASGEEMARPVEEGWGKSCLLRETCFPFPLYFFSTRAGFGLVWFGLCACARRPRNAIYFGREAWCRRNRGGYVTKKRDVKGAELL